MKNESIRIAAARSTLIAFESFSLGLLALFLYVALGRHAGWGGVGVTITLSVLIFIWWRAFLVEIRDGCLRYTSLFSPRREIKLDDIRSVVRRVERISAANRPPNRLEIHGVVGDKAVAFDINMKVFSAADVHKLESALMAKK